MNAAKELLKGVPELPMELTKFWLRDETMGVYFRTHPNKFYRYEGVDYVGSGLEVADFLALKKGVDEKQYIRDLAKTMLKMGKLLGYEVIFFETYEDFEEVLMELGFKPNEKQKLCYFYALK